jgi:ParB family chromosome partitioning protein
MSIVENLQREDLNPIEEAEAYHRLITEFDLTQDQAAARVGKSRPAVANMLRLRNLPDPIKESIVAGEVSMGHARALLGAENDRQQTAAWRKILAKGISVRETENLIKQLRKKKGPHKAKAPSSEAIYYSRLSEDLTRHYGTKVEIKRFGKRGSVSIEFYDDKDLERLLQLLQ